MPEDHKKREPSTSESGLHSFPHPKHLEDREAHRKEQERSALERAKMRYKKGLLPHTPSRTTVFPDDKTLDEPRRTPARSHTFPQNSSTHRQPQGTPLAASENEKVPVEEPESSTRPRRTSFSDEEMLDEDPEPPTRVQTFPLAAQDADEANARVAAQKRDPLTPAYTTTMGRFTFPEGGPPSTARGSLRVRPTKPEYSFPGSG